MCGICGTFSAAEVIPEAARQGLPVATRALAHRGPDASGTLHRPALLAGHTRLAIIDVATGQQPMVDEATGNAIVFNGEIYNYLELRAELRAAGHQFTTESDTEVILKGYAQAGAEFLTRLNGMFALALHDVARRELLLARDRFGEKPLYYFRTGERVSFASELGALRAFPDCPGRLRPEGVLEYYALGFLTGPSSICEGIEQVLPGHYLRVGRHGVSSHRYYAREPGPSRQWPDGEAVEARLAEAIRLRLRADVPVATLLSGGIDSSLITTLAQRATPHPLHSFAFGWAGEDAELPHARAIARHVGTTHHEILLSRDVFREEVRPMVAAMDMPFADSAAFVVHQLTKAIAARGVKVVLSGEGGDELFGGYGWYLGIGGAKRFLKRRLFGPGRGARDYVLSKVNFPVVELHAAFGHAEVDALIERRTAAYRSCGDTVSGRIAFDYQYFLPWMLMPKVDRMSMAHAVEVRAPFLDHHLVDEWARYPDAAKASRTETKIALRRICADRGLLPEEILSRKKMGMNLPLSWWIRTNQSLFRDVVDTSTSMARELFGRERIAQWFARVGEEDTPGWTRSSQQIWSAFVFELWRSGLPGPSGG